VVLLRLRPRAVEELATTLSRGSICVSATNGKTTTARLLAKALNCEKGPTPNPCNECGPCIDITAGVDVDVQEIDGASNNSVDQVRELRESARYNPARDRFKIWIIDEVHQISGAAFNALLKTLEEPPGDTLLILVADRTGRLPATVFSRCQRIEFAPPAESVGLAWLDRLQPGARWAEALRMAGNAPLAAIEALESLDTLATMSRELSAVGAGKLSPIEVAGRWSKLEAGFVLDWLARQLRQAALALAGGRDRAPGLTIDESVLKRMDRRNLFCYLDRINRLRGQPRGSYNVQLTLEWLLIEWAEGLADAGTDGETGGMRLMPTQR